MRLESWCLLITSLAAIVWPVVAVGAYASYRRCKSLLPMSEVDRVSAARPRISVVVPARNEEASIAAALQSLLSQRGVDLEVIVVDDHSTDATGLIASELARVDARLRVVRSPPLKDGWLGKTNAMRAGVRFATGDYVVFTDADIQHHPGSFAAAVHEMETERLSLLSLMPLFIWESIWENAAAPMFVAAMAGFMSGPIHAPDSDDAFAIGAFIMVDAEAYRRLGGHETVRREVLDDVMLARHFKQHGERVAFRAAPACLQVRMYRGLRAVFAGAIKSYLAAFGESFWSAIPLATTFAVGSLTVLASPLVGLLSAQYTLLGLGLLVYFEVWLSVVLARPYMRTRPLKVAGFVVGVPLLLAAALFATYQAVFHGSLVWRGRAIRIGS